MNIVLDYCLTRNVELFDENDKDELLKRIEMGLPSPFLLRVWKSSEKMVLYKITKFNNDTILIENMYRIPDYRKDVFWKRYLKIIFLYLWRWSNKL